MSNLQNDVQDVQIGQHDNYTATTMSTCYEYLTLVLLLHFPPSLKLLRLSLLTVFRRTPTADNHSKI